MNRGQDNLVRQIEGRCKHFNGNQYDACKAGINYLQLAGPNEGIALRLPCLNPSVFSQRRKELGYSLSSCPKLDRTTHEEAIKQADDIIKRREELQKALTAAHADAKLKGFRKGLGGSDCIPCPMECGGRLYYSVSGYNGHMHAKCDTEGCVSWME